MYFFFQAEDGIRDLTVTGVQTCALPICVPLVSATGSVAMGLNVAKTVHGRLGRSIMELGGNNALIVAPSADVDLATQSIFFGAVGTAGQRCTSTRGVIMAQTVAEDLGSRLL